MIGFKGAFFSCIPFNAQVTQFDIYAATACLEMLPYVSEISQQKLGLHKLLLVVNI